MTTAELLALLPEAPKHTEKAILQQSTLFGYEQFIHKSGRRWVASWDNEPILPGLFATKRDALAAMERYVDVLASKDAR